MNKPVSVSGIKPSGKLHIGNYLGAIKQYLAMQEDNFDNFYFVADYHALTQKYVVLEKNEEITGVAGDLIALGLDPKKSTVFIQSDVPEHNNLAWLLGTVLSSGQLQNMIEYKEKIEQGHSASAGLLNYPILMAGDVLSYKASFVPVGEDQRQHIELIRDVARNFNARFGFTFPEPKEMYIKGLRVKSLDDPNKKMSKSLPDGCLYLSDSPEIIRKKIKSAVTDSGSEIIYDQDNKPAIANLLLIYSELSNKPISEIVAAHQTSKYSQFKEALADVIINYFADFRMKREGLLNNRPYLRAQFKEGGERARAVASETLREAKLKMGLF